MALAGERCLLARDQPPALPYEIAVSVRLGDEAGAAGLAFHADGDEKHYGFYPSAGKLRLSRFEGPDVFSWRVLVEKPAAAYLPGEWNRLKVRVEKDKLSCYVNDELVIESTDAGLTSGRIGLAKFRGTEAQFRQFAIGKELASNRPSPDAIAKIAAAIDKLPPLAEAQNETAKSLGGDRPQDAQAVLLARAAELEGRARELKLLAADVRLAGVLAEFERVAGADVEPIDLLRAALTIAQLDEEDLDVTAYVKHVERMADEVRKKLPAQAGDAEKLAGLNDYLFKGNGYHGSRTDYYHRANSYLSRVIDDREGLPITLSVLYMELARRLGVKTEGVGLPGHFVVRLVPAQGEPQLIDVFDAAAPLTREAAETMVREFTGEPATDDHFKTAGERQILLRMLQNLLGVAQNGKSSDREAIQRYTSAMLVIDPGLVRERGLRAVVRWETGRCDAAVADIDVILAASPAGIDLDELRNIRDFFSRTKPPGR